MTQSKNLFFSEDEIEAVDMEIETLLLARKRQESQQQPPAPINTPQPLQPLGETPVASRPSPKAVPPVATSPAIRNPTSALPPQRSTEVGAEQEYANFRIISGGEDALPWPEPDSRTSQRRKSPGSCRYRFHCKWLIALAVALLIWAAVIAAGYATWQSASKADRPDNSLQLQSRVSLGVFRTKMPDSVAEKRLGIEHLEMHLAQ